MRCHLQQAHSQAHRLSPSPIPRALAAVLLLGLCPLVVVGCTRDVQSHSLGAASLPSHERTAPDSTAFTLVKVTERALGSDTATMPRRVGPSARVGALFVVFDVGNRSVRGYDRHGGERFRAALPSQAGLRSVMRLLPEGDSAFALLDVDGRLARFRTSGVFLDRRDLLTSAPASVADVARSDDWDVLAVIPADEDVTRGRASVLRAVRAGKAPRDLGCVPDAQYAASIARGGLLQLFRGTGVRLHAGRAYCRQPITPVVQSVDIGTGNIGYVRRAPDFYVDPPDRPESMNTVTVNQYRARWFEHLQFHPTATGFVSVYATFDTTRGASTYRVFACDSASGAARCGSRALPGKPLDFYAPDTLALPRQISAVVQLARPTRWS